MEHEDIELLSFDELSKLLSISKGKIRILVKKNQFPKYIRLGRDPFWRKIDIKEMLTASL